MTEMDHIYISSLVMSAQKNDSNAFAELYALSYKGIYNYSCHYLKDAYLAQDAVQEAYISAFRNINELKNPSLFIAWLNQITFHICFRLAKKRNEGYGLIDEEMIEMICDDKISANPENKTILNDTKKSLHDAIESLPNEEKQIIILRFFNNMKIDEIVTTTGLSKSTVKRKLIQAQIDLKNKMIEAGGASFE